MYNETFVDATYIEPPFAEVIENVWNSNDQKMVVKGKVTIPFETVYVSGHAEKGKTYKITIQEIEVEKE